MSYYGATRELIAELLQHKPQGNCLLVIGCSSSEVCGGHIGKNSSAETGAEIAKAAVELCAENSVMLAAQCCEHLNRALVVERETAEKRGYEIVSAVPQVKAGGSFATAVFGLMQDPVLVEEVQADLGLDIGQTLIGMHMKRVAVPVRLSAKNLGEAIISAAYSRPKLIGGERAKYTR